MSPAQNTTIYKNNPKKDHPTTRRHCKAMLHSNINEMNNKYVMENNISIMNDVEGISKFLGLEVPSSMTWS